MPTYDPATENLAIGTIKTLSIDGVEKAQSGHPGTPMGLADIAFELFSQHLRYDPKDPSWAGRDRFVLSCGHASMLLYSMLHLAGYDLSLEDLQQFRQWGSKTPGHPEHVHHTPGVETTTGPLGQGIANGVGFALAAKLKEARFGEPFAGPRTYVICSDGDVMEGVSGEASSLAGHLGLDNLVVIYDDNRITIEGETSLAFSEDVGKRYEAYGFFVQTVNGHDRIAIRAALDAAKTAGKPSFIVARTHIANGAPNAVDTSEAHGAPLGKDEIALVKTGLGFDPEVSFHVPEAVYALFQARAAELAIARAEWQSKVDVWRQTNADKSTALSAFEARHVPADLYEQLLAALPTKDDATRGLSNAIQQKVAELVPSLIGGSADLAPSTKTLIKNGGSVGAGGFAGRNLHFGIREHGMGGIVNGLALAGGIVPYGATFLVFSDYMRGSIRLSALGKLQTLWIFTHDSIFLGEDGPTHQPIEHLWALRMIPSLYVVRPADAMETAAAWVLALSRKDAPTAFSLTRQKVPTLHRAGGFDPKVILHGAYVLAEAPGGVPDLVIVATGSEVALAVAAAEELASMGRKVRVVSAPCLEAFEAQPEAYKSHVLPAGIPTVSIEAGSAAPWRAIVGRDGLTIGLDGYGASAPDKVLAEHFGLTVPHVTAKIKAFLGLGG